MHRNHHRFADPELESEEEKLTPLHFAAAFKPSQGEDATDDATAAETRSPGRHGAQDGTHTTSKPTVELLTRHHHVKVNCQDRYGVTPLHLACSERNISAVEILLQSPDIDPCVPDNNRNTPLHEASQIGNTVIVDKLLQWMSVEQKMRNLSVPNRERRSPLHLAARNGHEAIVKQILQYGFDFREELVAAEDNEGNMPLHLACESKDEETVRALLLNGADHHAVKSDEVYTFLLCSAKEQHCLTMLINMSVICNLFRLGWLHFLHSHHLQVSALHIAAEHGAVNTAKLLLEAGLHIQCPDAHQQSPLHYAARHNHIEMVNTLIERFANYTNNCATVLTQVV